MPARGAPSEAVSRHAATAPGTAAVAARRLRREARRPGSGGFQPAAHAGRHPAVRRRLGQFPQGGRHAVLTRLNPLGHPGALQGAQPGALRGGPGAQQGGDLGQEQPDIEIGPLAGTRRTAAPDGARAARPPLVGKLAPGRQQHDGGGERH